MSVSQAVSEQDFQSFLARYTDTYGDDVLTINESVSDDQDITAVVNTLAHQGRYPLTHFTNVTGLPASVVTNVFASRERVARMLDVTQAVDIHGQYQQRTRNLLEPREVDTGMVTEVVETEHIDLRTLPIIKHFETDRAPYITNAVIVSEDPHTGVGNLSYHRSMLHSPTELATSLHSRGDLWRLLNQAAEANRSLPVAMVIGAHPLFMLAASARVPYSVDERQLAGGLLGAPLDVVRTPHYGIQVPASAEIVLEGVIKPGEHADEGPFGEFTGYSSNRSTNNLLQVEAILRRHTPMLVDIVGGNSAEHLTLARVPREAEMVEKLTQRFPSVTRLHYPNSGTHFHAYVALKQTRPGEARQVMLGLLGWDPYIKTVIAVDHDVDVTRDEDVLWAMATHLQPHQDVMMVDGLPGSALDPSASGVGTTSRMGLDATRGPDFEGVRARVSEEALARASRILG